MKYLSVCAGIEAATCAWHHMGWEPVAFSEIEKFPSAVLAHHYPNVPNWGDMTKFKEWPDANIDVLVGGTPCQSFSVAGLRKGLDDPRGNLMLTFGSIAQRYRPEWLVWENVPGVLSSNGGRDFGSFLGMLGQLGYGFAYRVLDAQFHGVAQRRRRVFVVGHLGDWHRAAAVLFERHSLSGHPAPSRKTREAAPRSPAAGAGIGQPYAVANCLTQRMHKGINTTLDEGQTPVLVPQSSTSKALPTHEVVGTLNHSAGHAVPGNCSQDWNAGMLIPMAQAISFGAQMSTPQTDVDMVQTLQAKNPMAVAFTTEQTPKASSDVAFTVTTGSPTGGGHPQCVETAMQVRRLTPVECERLQGFPDGYTNIPWRGKPESPDGPRYKALGNSMAVPVMRWIGERINEVSKL
jgi:DNA (cytosine-5)-methyltransferase 1